MAKKTTYTGKTQAGETFTTVSGRKATQTHAVVVTYTEEQRDADLARMMAQYGPGCELEAYWSQEELARSMDNEKRNIAWRWEARTFEYSIHSRADLAYKTMARCPSKCSVQELYPHCVVEVVELKAS